MAVDIAQLSEREQVEVLEAALDLIIKPETWVKGQWKCPVYETKDEKNEFTTFKSITSRPVKDKQGNPLYAYCLEGAINQAVLDLYGYERASALGAYDEQLANEEGDDMGIAVENGTTPTDQISLNELVMQKYANSPMVRNKIAQGETRFAAMLWQDAPETTHEQVIELVRKKLTQLRRRIGRA